MLVHLKLVLAMFFYGVSFVSTKVALTAFGPLTILWIRLLLSAGFLLALDATLATRQPSGHAGIRNPSQTNSAPTATIRRWPLRSDLPTLLLVTLFQPFLYFVAENIGLRYVSASIASIIIATIPVFTPLLARPILGERVGPLTIVGLVLSLTGVAAIVLERQLEAQYTVGGLVLLFIAVAAAVGYSIAVKRVSSRYRPLTIVKLQSLFGLPLVLAMALFFEGLPRVAPDPTVIAHVLYLGIFPSSLAFVFLSGGIRELGANRASVYVNLVPAFTAVVAWLLLGELFTVQKLAGMAVVILGVLAAQRGQAMRRGDHSGLRSAS
jgi:drug/metabolite transporter (DMT)-like permease